MGKIIGTAIGFMFGRWLGAILGFYLGYLFDKKVKDGFNQAGGFQGFFDNSSHSEKQALFAYTCYAVMGHIAKSNGRVNEQHIQAASTFMDEMGLMGESRKEAQAAFRAGKAADFPFKQTLKDFRASFAGRYDLLQLFLEIQIQMAYSDGVLSANEVSFIEQVGQVLGIHKTHVNFILKRYRAEFEYHKQQRSQQQQNRSQSGAHQASSGFSTRQQALSVLGLGESADAKEIKRAYRKLMAQHHPDKLVAQGLPADMMKVAVKKSQDIQAAYEYLKKTV